MSTPNPVNPQVTTQQAYDATLLLCPRCGGDYLHHGQVEVFARTEDAAVGLHTTTSAGDVRVDRDLSGNPSARRHGVTIAFSCELCDEDDQAVLRLTIAQHKGQTFLAWE